VVTGRGVAPATVLFDERIRDIVAWDSAPEEIVDYGDLVIMPGLVDSHVHVNEPGRTEWEGFITATRAAAAGGVTTIVDMPLNSIPATTTLGALCIKQRELEGKCTVDVALWGGVVPGNIRELRPMLDAGARGFKCFLVHSGVDDFPNVSPDELRAAARELAPTGAPLLVHAELPGPIDRAAREIAGRDPDSYGTYLDSRPPAAEDEAIALLRNVCAETGARIHIVHLSSASAIDIVKDARSKGLSLSAETTPHYLHFESEQIPAGHNEFKCAPPIREHANRERLWKALQDGVIETIVSDHSPCTPALKQGSFLEAWGGIASVQFVLPVIWTEAKSRGFGFSDLTRWLCERTARLARLPHKGAIEQGRDADFAIWSPEETFTIDASTIEHRHKLTPYLGETLAGVVKETWVRGRRVFPFTR
jgi:allantoinase